MISTKDTSRVSWVWVCHNESWKKFSLGLIKDQICASVLPGHDWGAGGKTASCAHPESLAAAFWAQDFVSCCCHSALWRHLHNPVVAVSSAMFHCPPSTKGGSVGHPHPQGCAQPELYELCPSPTHCPTFWRTPLLPKQSSPQNTAELPMPEPCSLPGIPQSHLSPCSPNATAWTPLRHQEQTDPYRSPTRDQQMCCWMVLAACLAGAKTSDSRNSFGQGWNEGCLVGNNEPIAPSGESAGQLPWQGIKTWRRKKNTTKTNQKALSWLTPTASTYRACFQNRRNEFVVQRIKTGIQSLPIQKLQTAIKHNRLHKAAAQPPMSGQCHQTFPQHFLFPYVHIYITHISI